MAIQFQVYANLDPIYFKVTKNGLGVAGLTFSTGDISISIDGAAWVDIDTEVAEMVGASSGRGWYVWTPTGTETTGKVIIVNVAEVSGTNFDENGLAIATGGNASARHSG
jgi:hypothetical protein